MAFPDHLLRRVEKRRVQELDEHPEPEMVALVRSSGKQQQVACMTLESLHEFEVLRLADAIAGPRCRQVMRFVEHDQVPRRRALQRINAGYEPVVFREGVGLSVRDIPFAPENLEVEMENFVEFAMPVVH